MGITAQPLPGLTPASLCQAEQRAREVAASPAFELFVDMIRARFPWRFQNMQRAVLDRDYLRIVDHHLRHLIPRVGRYMEPRVQKVLDFGCGSGGSAIALALVYPHIYCVGTDIDEAEISVARERARLYGVADRCRFQHVQPGAMLPMPEASFDLSLCSSVLEYAIQPDIRRFCVREIARMVRLDGSMFFAVPNRLYPFEIHTMKWGWNYFPKLLNARTVDCTAWEVKKLARPTVLKLHRTPIVQLFRPWSAFCLKRDSR